MTDSWLCVIPRRRAAPGSPIANGAGMMGAVWVRDPEERRMWDTLGPSAQLSQQGIPISP
ncbi:ATP adenylyltransferase domain-containing protein [Purpureocillium lilacinum]|uniref:ATP adenylyltransferase domain-containing protein n=1 Tax=Purpureocillium lilacinum TaxID=33203 RepID=A0A179GDB2_PURLI|nr:ATP adenylyltransferase domain-containing protein [Purpureocillium lilacinum]